MFHSERPHWSDWIQNMPLFKVGSVMDNSWKEKNFKWWLKDYVKAMIPWLFRK